MNCLTIRQFIQKTQDIFFFYSLPASHVNTIAKKEHEEQCCALAQLKISFKDGFAEYMMMETTNEKNWRE